METTETEEQTMEARWTPCTDPACVHPECLATVVEWDDEPQTFTPPMPPAGFEVVTTDYYSGPPIPRIVLPR